MYITLKGNCEKIIVIQEEKQQVIYNGDKVSVDDEIPISLLSAATKKRDVIKYMITAPFRILVAIFDVILMNTEWDWAEKI